MQRQCSDDVAMAPSQFAQRISIPPQAFERFQCPAESRMVAAELAVG